MIFKLEAREMSEKAQYRTRQITELENYLCSMEGKHVTVSDICKYFKSQGISIGTTTVYRQLDRMVEQGLVAKYVVDGTPAVHASSIWDMMSIVINIYAFIANARSVER